MAAGRRRELILYATPTGELADACARYFLAVERLGSTEAQAYPPHITLTGFFRRRPQRSDEVVDEVRAELTGLTVPDGAVDVVGLRSTDDWVGLEIRSPWLETLCGQVFDGHRFDEKDDPVRPKTDLHLSLAYEVDAPLRDAAACADLARELVDPDAAVEWEVALWERDAGRWTRLT